MALIVQKFGGTSVGSVQRMREVVKLVRKEREYGNQVILVVSAMAGVTDQLINHATSISQNQSIPDWAEYDNILSTGEQISCGMLVLALKNEGIAARSWLGWQLPISTDGIFSHAKIIHIETKHLISSLGQGEVPVIAGFQGVYNGRIVTLGRGGSDTTAAAIAAAVKADRCDIYTDVDGIYTCDPKIVPKARKLKQVAFDEMLELASSGAKVLHSRSVEIAMKYNLKMQVLSSFDEKVGTMIVGEEEIVEKQMITGITCRGDMASITLRAISGSPDALAQLFNILKENNINVDLIIKNISNRDKTDITFTIDKTSLEIALNAIKSSKDLQYRDIIVDDNIAKVSVIGIGMKSHSSAAQKMFQILSDRGITILVVSTSEIKISVLIHAEYMELAVRALHTGYNLDK